MVSHEAIRAIEQVLAKRCDDLREDMVWRRKTRKKNEPLLNSRRLTEARNGKRLEGLHQVLSDSGGPSDSSRVLGRVKAKPEKIRKWCDQLLDTSAMPVVRLAVVQDSRMIAHLSRNAFSVLLHLKQPDRFGLLNRPVQNALKALGEWPRFPPGSGQGDKYLLVNAVLDELANKVGLDKSYPEDKFTALDQLLWYFSETGEHIKVNERPGSLSPGDPDKDAELAALEGDKKLHKHIKSERSSKLIASLKILRLLKDPDLECEICGFSFVREYGEIGKGFIEAHHRESLATRGPGVTRGNDFDFVCSNCHRMLHRMKPDEMDKVCLIKLLDRNRK